METSEPVDKHGQQLEVTVFQLALLKGTASIIGFFFLASVSLHYFLAFNNNIFGVQFIVSRWLGMPLAFTFAIAGFTWATEWLTLRQEGKGLADMVYSDTMQIKVVNILVPIMIAYAWFCYAFGFNLEVEKVSEVWIDFSLLALSFTALFAISEHLASNPKWLSSPAKREFMEGLLGFEIDDEAGQQEAILSVVRRIVELATIVILVAIYIYHVTGRAVIESGFDEVVRSSDLLVMSAWLAMTVSRTIARRHVMREHQPKPTGREEGDPDVDPDPPRRWG